jgi:tRNA A-37 threonylcarbamoyl transferase component Bud32
MENRWNDIICDVFGKDTKLIFPRFFYSKKNQVTLLNLEREGREFRTVAKFFVWGSMEKEKNILEKAMSAGLKTPVITAVYENIIFMEYIPGITAKTITASGGAFPVRGIALWLSAFHKTFKNEKGTILKGDAMPPNFILHRDTGEIYGIDFEESNLGEEIEDISDIFATIMMLGRDEERVGQVKDFLKHYLDGNPININFLSLKKLTVGAFERRFKYQPEQENRIRECITIIENAGKDFFNGF